MQRSLSCYTPLSTSEAESSFNVVIAYEDFETGKHAKATYDYLSQNLGPDCQFSNQMWKFDVLGIPKLREMAARDASLADIIVISCRGYTELPTELKAWMELWLAEGSRAIGLVLLFDSPQDPYQLADITKYLAGVAKRAQIEFFAQPHAWRGSNARTPNLLAGPADSQSVSTRTLATLAGAVHRETPFPRWGINE